MMTRSWMDVLPPPAPSSCYPGSNWLFGERRSGSGTWTHEENRRFEDALAKYDRETPERWEQVAAMIPGKTVADVKNHYSELLEDVNEIEAGRIPCPGYSTSSFTWDWDSSYSLDGFKQAYCIGGKGRSGGRADQERKKGVPWTEEEHKLFLIGLQKYGKGIGGTYLETMSPPGLLLKWLVMLKSTSLGSTQGVKIKEGPAYMILLLPVCLTVDLSHHLKHLQLRVDRLQLLHQHCPSFPCSMIPTNLVIYLGRLTRLRTTIH